MKTTADAEFDRIVMCEVRKNISEAFLLLEYEVSLKQLNRTQKCMNPEIVKRKASQMKQVINSFIDSQVVRITGESSVQAQNENQETE